MASRDAHVYIFSGSLKAQITRGLIASVVVVFLLAPMMICNVVTDTASRMAVIVIATIMLITVLSFVARSKTVEMFMTGTA